MTPTDIGRLPDVPGEARSGPLTTQEILSVLRRKNPNREMKNTYGGREPTGLWVTGQGPVGARIPTFYWLGPFPVLGGGILTPDL